MKFFLLALCAFVFTGCAQTPSNSDVPYSVTVQRNILSQSQSIFINSRFNIHREDALYFCGSTTAQRKTNVLFRFDCDFSSEQVEELTQAVFPMLDNIFEQLGAHRASWIGEYDWCIYIVEGSKGYNRRKSASSCLTFYVSENKLKRWQDLNYVELDSPTRSKVLKSNTAQFLSRVIHEGFHAHTFLMNEVSGVDFFLNELQAYLLSQYVYIYSQENFELMSWDRYKMIESGDRNYFIEHCQTEGGRHEILSTNQGRESALANIAINQLFLDVGIDSQLAILYLDFVWDYMSKPNTSGERIFSLIPSCNPQGSSIIDSIKSALIDYDLGLEIAPFPTTSYFRNKQMGLDEIDLFECDWLKQETFAYYTCIANFIDVYEQNRYKYNIENYLLDLPLIFESRVAHMILEREYNTLNKEPEILPEKFYFIESLGLYTNNLGYVADTASALNVNLQRECREDLEIQAPRIKTLNLNSHKVAFNLCSYSDSYGASWSNEMIGAKILGNMVSLRPGSQFIGLEKYNLNKSRENVAYTVQGGLPVIQLQTVERVSLNACIDSGSTNSFYTRRYSRRLLKKESKLEFKFRGQESSSTFVLSSLRQSSDSLMQCDIIMGADFMAQFPLIYIGKKYIQFKIASNSEF